MRKTGWLALVLLTALPVTQVQAQALTGCAGKQSEIEAQLAQAQAAGNKPQAAGLEKALKEARAHCTDSGLQQQRQQKVDKAKKEVAEREADLEKAKRSGKQKKIDKQQRKLDEAREEQKAAEQELLK